MTELRVIPWGWKRRGGWQSYNVGSPVGDAHEVVCKHDSRSRAEACIAHRTTGGNECIDRLRVGEEWAELLDSLSRLSATAHRQKKDPEALRKTAEQIRDIAAGIVAMTSPKRPAATVDLVDIAKSVLGVRS